MAAKCKTPVYKPVKFSDYGDILTAQEAGQILHCSADRINGRCRNGDFPGAAKLGSSWRIPKKSIMAMFGNFYGREEV